jgi:hypothetical protein
MDIYRQNHINPYRNFKLPKLLRIKVFYLFCRFPFLVKNLKNIYDTSSMIIGQNKTNSFIKNFCCDIFTGGSNLKELEESVKDMQKSKVYLSLALCKEFLTKEEEHVFNYINNKEAEKIVDVYLKKIDIAMRYNSLNTIAMKFSSMADFEILKKYNKVQEALDIIENSLLSNVSNNDIRKLVVN